MNIADYIQSAREGSAEAISALFDEYKNSVWFLARALIGEDEDIENILSYTFYQAFHRINVLKKPENFGMWLNIITANRCHALLREKHPMSFIQSDDGKHQKVKFNLVNTPADSALTLDPDACNTMGEVCDRLPDQLRFSEILYFYAQMTITQIAKVMECDESKIKLNITRAEAQIKAEVDALSIKNSTLSSYKSGVELYPVLSACAERVKISEKLTNDIVAISVTLALSAPAVNSEKKIEAAVEQETAEPVQTVNEADEEGTPPPIFDNTPDKEAESEVRQGDKFSVEKKAAIRNILTIAIVLILAASIIIGSVVIIKNAAATIKTPAQSSDTTQPVSDNVVNDTTEPVTEESTVPEPEQTTEPEVIKPVETEPEVTEPEPVTAPPEEMTDAPIQANPSGEGSMTKIEADAVFTCKDVNGEVTITKYIGSSREVDVPAMIDGHPVTVIGYMAFKDNTNIVSVTLPSTVTEIADSAFHGCTSLTGITMPSTLTKLGTYAFYNCTSLVSIKLPSTITSAGLSVFGQTAWLSSQKNDFVIGGDGFLFKYIGVDTDITVPANVKHILNAFYYNTSIKTVIIQSGVTDLGMFAFCGCSKLTSVTIPDTVTDISTDAFLDNKSLTEILVPSGSYAESWCKDNGLSALVKTY